MKSYGLYINGEWMKSVSGKTFQTANPAKGEVPGTSPRGKEEVVIKAIKAAGKAWQSWGEIPSIKRVGIMLKAVSMRGIRDMLRLANPIFIYHDAFNPRYGRSGRSEKLYRKGNIGDVVVKA